MELQKTHYTAAELVDLPGMPKSTTDKFESKVRAIQIMANRENWEFRNRQGRGGGREYPISALPVETRDHLMHALVSVVAEVPAITQGNAIATIDEQLPAKPAELKEWQRECMDARMRFIRLIEQADGSGIGVSRAIRHLVALAAAGKLPAGVQDLVAVANKRSGRDTKKRALSERSLYRWWGTWKEKGNPVALAPKDTELDPDTGAPKMPAWAPDFLRFYRRPQKPSVQQAIADMTRDLPGAVIPTRDQAYRFIEKFSSLDIQKGRMTGAELARLKGYKTRDASMYEPFAIALCDGHSCKGYVAHPRHGRHFKPEICGVIDATTRFMFGWSAGLAESNQTVADALRHAMTINESKPIGGMIAIWYTDQGAGNEAAVNADPYLGRYARLGITHQHGRPGNPKGRGRIERPNQSVWIPMMKRLPTYTGKDMDAGAARKVYLHLEKSVREAKKTGSRPQSKLLISWNDFLALVQETVDEYNDRPHTKLPKITDQQTGRIRHMSPREYLQTFIDKGWRPSSLPEDQLADLFRPWEEVTTRNGRVTLFGKDNWYYHRDLEHYHGRKVILEYEVQDGSKVWVRDTEHKRLICCAKYHDSEIPFFAPSAVEIALEQRETRRLALVEKKAEEIRAERQGVFEAHNITPEPKVIEARRQLEIEMARPAMPPAPAPVAQPATFTVPATAKERYRLWCALDGLIVGGEEIGEAQLRFYEGFRKTADWRAFRGIDEDMYSLRK